MIHIMRFLALFQCVTQTSIFHMLQPNIETVIYRTLFSLISSISCRRYFIEDLVVNREANTVERAPKKDYYALKAEIDRYLVLNKSKTRDRKSEAQLDEDEDDSEIIEDKSEDIFEEGLEEEEEDEEDNESEELEDEEATEHHEEKVFQSLIETYGWPRAEDSIFSISTCRSGDSR